MPPATTRRQPTAEDGLEIPDKADVHFDFGAWESFHKSLPKDHARREALRRASAALEALPEDDAFAAALGRCEIDGGRVLKPSSTKDGAVAPRPFSNSAPTAPGGAHKARGNMASSLKWMFTGLASEREVDPSPRRLPPSNARAAGNMASSLPPENARRAPGNARKARTLASSLKMWMGNGLDDDDERSGEEDDDPTLNLAKQGTKLNDMIEACEELGYASESNPPKNKGRKDPDDLTEEEEYDNAAWRMRLTVGSAFCRDYKPQIWESKEMEEIVEFMALKDPNSDDSQKEKDEPGNQVTERAIGAIFFAEPGEPQSVLLKRGPVLLNGEERELMIFTNGFLFSRVELDTLVTLLLEGNSKGAATVDVTSAQLSKQFRDIDSDRSLSLDRGEVNDFFQGMGMPLSKPALDGIMNKFDSDSDGTISWQEFKSMMHEMKTHQNKPAQKSNGGSCWWSLGSDLRQTCGRTCVTRKLDLAFLMADVKRIENLGICHSEKTRAFADSDWAHLTLAVHVKGKRTPLLVTCAKTGHVEAWMEAFRRCLTSLKSLSPPCLEKSAYDVNRSHRGLINGVRDRKVVKKVRKDRSSLAKWEGTPLDWGERDK